MYYLFFDTETTGVPKNYKASCTDTKNWPRMVQLAYIIADQDGNTLAEYACIIRPDGYTIPDDASRIHGITTERALAEGIRLETALDGFGNALADAGAVVCHNYAFDHKIVGAEMCRMNHKPMLKFMLDKPHHCTMEESTDFCGLPGYYGPKWPKLEELHQILFGENFEGAHDALNDVRATVRCFFELQKRGIIPMPKP